MRAFANFNIIFGILFFPTYTFAKPNEICVFQDKSGNMMQTNSLSNVPRESRAKAKCGPAAKPEHLARPEDIKLEGTQRTENITSALGPVQIRWPRKVESLFGRTPLRAVTEAANAVSRTIKKGAFPSEIQNLNADWKIVFMDANLPTEQIPSKLRNDCHPGWMIPPANIYIVAQRVAGGCGGQKSKSSVADSTLAEVLIHEMGHVVEYYMLKDKQGSSRMRAEGFATWFTAYAAQSSSIVSGSKLKDEYMAMAKMSFKHQPKNFSFGGSAEDYARASMFFTAIVNARGLPGLVAVYEEMGRGSGDIIPAIEKALGWNEERLNKEVLDLVGGK